MNPESIEGKRITARLLEAHFSSVPILLDYLNSLNHPASRRVKKAYMKNMEKIEENSQTPDSSECIFAFVAYLLKHPEDIQEENPEKLKLSLAIMAEKFCKANALAGPFPGYNTRVKIPASGAQNPDYEGRIQ